MNILGISAFYHDAAACLFTDGQIVGAVEEERFTGIKHDHSFPINSIRYLLHEHYLTISDIDKIVWYEKPDLKRDRVLSIFSKRPFRTFWLKREFKKRHSVEGNIKNLLRQTLNYSGPVKYVDHHLSHAAFSYFTSPYKDATIVTIDGVGEWETLTISKAKGKKITKVYSQPFPHSLGMFYSTMTAYLGFKPNEGEYKVMGLAPYGNPYKYYNKLKKVFITPSTGLFELDQKYFTWEYSERVMFTKKLCRLLELPPRLTEEEMTQDYMDLAAAVQKIYETFFCRIIAYASSKTPSNNLCLSGGCAYNGVANTLAYKFYGSVHIPFSPSDSGSAIGAVLYSERTFQKVTPFLGPKVGEVSILTTLFKNTDKLEWVKLPERKLIKRVAEIIHAGCVVGWVQGRMEFGSRALGNRSILASPLKKDMKTKINKVIKKREGFRPFAPSCLEEEAPHLFQITEPIPYMNQVVQVKNKFSSAFPAITHIDNSARVQTVDTEINERYRKLLEELKKISGYGMVLNTSFNFKDQTITRTAQEAVERFLDCEMDYLIINNYLIRKK